MLKWLSRALLGPSYADIARAKPPIPLKVPVQFKIEPEPEVVELPKPTGRAFPFSALLDRLLADADAPAVTHQKKNLKSITCGCGHVWKTKRHRLGLPIKCPKCHTTWADIGQTVCRQCGNVYSSKRKACPKCKFKRT